MTDDVKRGPPGLRGERGLPGRDGLDGRHGRDGADGTPGQDGKPGKDGRDGRDAYQAAVAKGFRGTEDEWFASLKGEKGDQGEKGDTALTVEDVARGLGFDSPDAWQDALQGKDGRDGVDGAPGTHGKDGAPGKRGPKGEPGEDGRTILNGSGAPSASIGEPGDFYIDTKGWFIYGPKREGGWGSGVPLRGKTILAAGGPDPTGSGGGGTWGSITGTITAQTDLVSYVAARIAELVDAAPATLDTLNELAAALADDASFAATMTSALAGKAAASDLSTHIADTANPHSVTKAQVGLSAVTNDAQTKAAIVPNTVPSAGQILAGNAGGTAYAPVSLTGDVTVTSAGVTAIGASKVTEAMQLLADNTTGDVSTTKHGYAPKAPNDTAEALLGDGAWGVPYGQNVTASEDLSAGNLVNLWNDSGTIKARKANATAAGKHAHGFVLASATTGNAATVYPFGTNTAISGMTVGDNWLSTTGGGVTTTPPSGSGNVVQVVGVALSATKLVFQPGPPITLA